MRLRIAATDHERKDVTDKKRGALVNKPLGFIEDRVAWSDGNVVVREKTHFPDDLILSFWGKLNGKFSHIASKNFPGMFLVNVTKWRIDASNDSAIWVSLCYGSGSANRIVIFGRRSSGRWGTLLSFDTADALRYPAEAIDFSGNGRRDVIALTKSVWNKQTDKFDPSASESTIWRWSDQFEQYVKWGTFPYSTRLKPWRDPVKKSCLKLPLHA